MNLTLCVVTKSQIYALTSACVSQITSSHEFPNVQLCLCIGQSDLPKARSSQLSHWYEKAKQEDVFMFIDADQIFVPKDIQRALELIKTYDVVCGAYPRKDGAMTLEPKNIVQFNRNLGGDLYYGATGMMMISYNIVDKIAKEIGPSVSVSRTDKAYPFFLERIVNEKVLGPTKDLWLSEDYSFCWLVRKTGGVVHGFISPTIGHIISMEKFVDIPKVKTWPSKSIVIYCGETSEKWSPNSLSTGIGGSETAVIHLARFWAQNNYSVTVFCNCDQPDVYDNVNYVSTNRFNPNDSFDIIILWRGIEMADIYDFSARCRILDLHDLILPSQATERIFTHMDKICVKSEYQKSLLNSTSEKIVVIPNGGAIKEDMSITKDPNYIIYSSSYDRGLPYMLKWGWPLIKKACPDAYLNIYYGWNGFDARVSKLNDPINIAESNLYKDTVLKLMNQEGVKERGRISNSELIHEKTKANVHYYVGDFQEIDCISVRESACVGAIPVVSGSVEVFNEKPYCIKISGDPHSRETQEEGAQKIIQLIQNSKEVRENIILQMQNCKESWKDTAEKWMELF